MSRRADLGSLVAGAAIVVLGLVLLLREAGTIELEAGWLLPILTALTAIVLLASGFGARSR
jgi:hypothetical protein